MTQQEYEQKRRECWKEFIGKDGFPTPRLLQGFYEAFDRGYALGKQEKGAELHEVNFAKTDMEKINGIIKDGKVYVALQDGKDCFSCQGCDLYSEGGCIYSSLCFYLGRCNIFRYSPELTEKINKI